MVRKPKAALALQTDTAPSPATSPTVPNGKTRRSSRRTSSKPAYAEKGSEDEGGRDTLDGEGDETLEEAAQLNMTGRARPQLQRKSWALKRNIRDLEELDDKLHGDSKRQKRLLEEGAQAADPDQDAKQDSNSTSEGVPDKLRRARASKHEHTPMRRRTKAKASVAAVGRDISGGEEAGDGDDTYVASDDDLKDGDKTVLEVAERGAARPPAVNSSYLPLPWKGRLGYVSCARASRQPPIFTKDGN